MLDKRGIRHERYAIVGRYVVDIKLLDHPVIIEADGVTWHRKRIDYDIARDAKLANLGYTVMHFSDIDMTSRRRAEIVLGQAIDLIESGQARYRPPTLWRQNAMVRGEFRAPGDPVGRPLMQS
jgi:very-short-patch-repair endonuclease